jgi:hypothetical protein
MELLLQNGRLKFPIHCPQEDFNLLGALVFSNKNHIYNLKGGHRMPYIVTRAWYPPSKSDETVKKYLEVLEKYPFDESLGKQVVPVAGTVSKDGNEVLVIVEVEIPKVGEALEWVKRFMIEFRNIEGYTYEVKTWATAEEGLARLGVS